MTENFRKNEKLCYEDFGRLILSLSPEFFLLVDLSCVSKAPSYFCLKG